MKKKKVLWILKKIIIQKKMLKKRNYKSNNSNPRKTKKLILIFRIAKKRVLEDKRKRRKNLIIMKKKPPISMKNKKTMKLMVDQILNRNIFFDAIQKNAFLLRNFEIKIKSNIVKSTNLMKFMNNKKSKEEQWAREIIYLKVIIWQIKEAIRRSAGKSRNQNKNTGLKTNNNLFRWKNLWKGKKTVTKIFRILHQIKETINKMIFFRKLEKLEKNKINN